MRQAVKLIWKNSEFMQLLCGLTSLYFVVTGI